MFLEMKINDIWYSIISILMTLLIIVCISIAIFIFIKAAYKDGQIDALTGNVKYELIENEKKEMYWKKIDNFMEKGE